MWRKVLGEEKGSVMVMVVIGLIVLIGFTGLVIDGGSLYLTKSRLQNAADAASLAGAQKLPIPGATANTAITYAGINGMKPLWGDASPSNSGNTYIASRSGDTVKVDYIESTEWSSIQPMYTEEEINQKEAELTAQLNTMSATELMAEADVYSISYVTTGGYTYDMLNIKSNYELLGFARTSSVTSGLTTKTISSMTKAELLQCANDNKYPIPGSYLTGGVIKDSKVSAVRTELADYLGSTQGTYVSNKTALINGLLPIYGGIIALADPAAVRGAILEKYRAELEAQQKVVNQGHPDQVRVTCMRTVQNSFMAALGFRNSTVSATAVAEWRVWAGEALPFVNMDDIYSENPHIEAWEGVSPGDKERIHDDVIETPTNSVIKLDILDDNDGNGPYMYMKGGFAVGSEIPTPLKNIVVQGNNVYLLSLRDDLLDEGNSYAHDIGNINKYHLPMSDLVLLKCIVEQDWSNSEKTCHLTFVEAYDWNDAKNTFVMGAPPKLVE